MNKLLFSLIILISFLLISCEDDSIKDKCTIETCTQEYKECKDDQCVFKDGYCEQNYDCIGENIYCDSSTHKCIEENSDKCLNISCEEWQECDQSDGLCKVKTDRCGNNGNCKENQYCDRTIHECKESTNICDGVTCSNHGNCTDSGGVAKCDCNENYHLVNKVECISNKKNVSCIDNAPDNAKSNIVDVEVLWVNNSWETASDCSWVCNPDYTKDGDNCVITDKCANVTCGDNSSCELVNSEATCVCDLDYHKENDECLYDAKEISCIPNNIPDNAHSIIEDVVVLWIDNSWEVADNCSWVCDANYTKDGDHCVITDRCANVTCGDNSSCELVNDETICVCDLDYHKENDECLYDAKEISCIDSAPNNAHSIIEDVVVLWIDNSWEVADDCSWVCDADYTKDGDICVITDKCANVSCEDNSSCEVSNNETICVCNEDYHRENDECLYDAKEVPCIDNAPDNAHSIIEDVMIEWVNNRWEIVDSCEWICNTDYTKDGDICVPIDKCANASCEEWQECNSENGNCELKNGRCETADNCEVNQVCTEHSCVDSICNSDGDDYSSANNNYGGFYNSFNYPNTKAFAALSSDGSITAWGDRDSGGSGAPTDNGYIKIYSAFSAFAALKSDGSITAWGNDIYNGAPTDNGYIRIYSASDAFAALKSDGSITAWGGIGGSGEPTDNGYVRIYSNSAAFAALKEDGSITAWGIGYRGGEGEPTDNGYTTVVGTSFNFAALKSDGSIKAWGDNSDYNISRTPTDSGYTQLASTDARFAALKENGSVTIWGNASSTIIDNGGYTKLFANYSYFAALKEDGSIKAWGMSNVPTDNGYIKIYATHDGFAAIKADGSISSWGYYGVEPPTDNGYTKIYSNRYAFAALKEDGSITTWGSSSYGGSGAPTDNGYVKIYSTKESFAAIKEDGSISVWGNSSTGGAYAPSGTGYKIPYGGCN